MSAPGTALDRAIDRVLAVAGDADGVERSAGLLVFQRILLLHLAVRTGFEKFPFERGMPELPLLLAAVFAACLAATFVRRLVPIAIAGALCGMLALLHATFPKTSNHFFLELWVLLLSLVIGGDREGEAPVLLAALRFSIAILLFYTGVQKLLYGTYFHGQYLLVEMALKPPFAAVLGWTLPADELARVTAELPDHVGAGPYRTDAPLLLLASNAVYLFELAIPGALLWRRTRAPAVVAVGVFVFAIQSGATELFFGALLVNCVLLFWPRDLHRRAWPVFVGFYLLLIGLELWTPWRFV